MVKRIENARIEALTSTSDQLGESPIWDDRTHRLYWVDIRAPAIRWLETDGSCGRLTCPATVGCLALTQGRDLLAALQTGFSLVDLTAGRFDALVDPERARPDNRFNDGRVDRSGNFWASTMNDTVRQPDGSLYRLAPDCTVSRHLSGWDILNATAFSPAGDVLYQADTFNDRIWAFPLNASDGVLGLPRLLLDTSPYGGHPDGATIDSDGALWIALQGAGRLLRITPGGVVDRIIELPVSQPTSCTFGGADLTTLFVTSAAQRLTPEELCRQPMAGAILSVPNCGSGLAEPRWGVMPSASSISSPSTT